MSDLKKSFTSDSYQPTPESYLTGTNPTTNAYTTHHYGISSNPTYASDLAKYGISTPSPLVSYNYTTEIHSNHETPVRSAGSYHSGAGLTTSQLAGGYLAEGHTGSQAGGYTTAHHGTGSLTGSQIGAGTYGIGGTTGGLGGSYQHHYGTGSLTGSQTGAGSYLAGPTSYNTGGLTGVTGLAGLTGSQVQQPGTYTTTSYNVGTYGAGTAGTGVGSNYASTYSSGIHGTSATGTTGGLASDTAVNAFLGGMRTSVIREVKTNMEYRGPEFGKELRSYLETNVQAKPVENRKSAVVDTLRHYNLVSSDRLNNPQRIWQDAGISTTNAGSYTQPSYTTRDASTYNLGSNVNVESYQTPQRTTYGYTTESEHQKRSTQSVPSHLHSQSRVSYLDPYRQSSYPEFAIVEDLPDRTHLVDSINIFLRKSPAKERLLVSPSRVSIQRESILHPAEIEVTSLFKEKYEDGSVYEGGSKNGKKHGKGRITYRDGRVFEGEFENGKAVGTGKINYSTGKLCYEGGISDTSFEGQGTLQIEIPTTINGAWDYKDFRNLGKAWLRYEGEFRGGHKHGTGTLYLSNGEKYTGEFRDDEIHGKGVFTLRDGRGIHGEWRHGVLQN